MALASNGQKVPPKGQLPIPTETELAESPFERWLNWAEVLLHLKKDEAKKPN